MKRLLFGIAGLCCAMGVAQANVISASSAGFTNGVASAPVAPQDVLYDQLDNDGGAGTSSQDFEASFDIYDDQGADDFVVPPGISWSIESVDTAGVYFNGAGPADSFNVYFYTNAGGLPGTLVDSRLAQAYTNDASASIAFASPITLSGGTYWVSVQARMDFGVGGQWGWETRSVQNGAPAAWQNPGDGLGTGCTSWGSNSSCTGGAADFMFRLNGTSGSVAATFPPDENFDEVTAPSLPPGWTTAFSGAGIAWATNTTFADTAPNAAFAPDMSSVSDMTLDSPAFIPGTGQRLTFNHKYLLESTFDGAVLEISSDGGTTFQDIIAAGGSFSIGGYNGTISTSFMSPIAGRPAWTGDSGGFVTTEVALPAAAVGQPTVLRFRTADDSSVPSTGWWVDTIHLEAGPPVIDVSPASLSASLVEDTTSDQTLTISNTGASDLNWSITEATPSAPTHQGASRSGAVRGTPGAWTNASPVPANLARYAFAQDGDDLYVAGGVADGVVVGTLYRYNTASDTWATLASMPVSTGEAPTGAYFNGKLYVVGGVSQTVLNIYDIATNTWSSGAPFPDAGGSYGAAGGAFNGKFFVAGGTGGVASTTLWVYDIAGNTWSAGTTLPSGYYLGGYQQVGQYVYLVGSYGDAPQPPFGPASALSGQARSKAVAPNANGTATLRLDMTTATGAWTIGPEWTMNRADFGLAYDPGMHSLYAIGGDANGGGFFDSQTEVDQLDISAWPAGTWVVSDPALPSPLQANQAGFYSTGVAGGEIWSTGGLDGGTFLFHNTHQYRTNGIPSACSSPSDIPWVSVAPTSGTTAAGDSSDITVTFDATGLAPATYSGLLCVASNDPATALIEVPISLEVTPAPPGACNGGADEIFCDGFDGDPVRIVGLNSDLADFLADLSTGYYDNALSSMAGTPITMGRTDYAAYNPVRISTRMTD